MPLRITGRCRSPQYSLKCSNILYAGTCYVTLKPIEYSRHSTTVFRAGYSCETQLAVTIDDFTRNYDLGSQTDIAILDFSKAFDTVPHDKLLHELDAYGIRGPLLSWIKAFLCNRPHESNCRWRKFKWSTRCIWSPPRDSSRSPTLLVPYKWLTRTSLF